MLVIRHEITREILACGGYYTSDAACEAAEAQLAAYKAAGIPCYLSIE